MRLNKNTGRIGAMIHAGTSLCVLAFCFCTFHPSTRVLAQARQADTGVALSGKVLDATGKPADGAQVNAEPRAGGRAAHAQTNAAGRFQFRALQPGTYTVYAARHGVETSRSMLVIPRASRRDLTIVLGATPAAVKGAAGGGLEFSDNPTFAVAGVTDWTAVGGHGSDATLRTSEDLTRETLALRENKPTPASGKSGRLGANDQTPTEESMRSAVATSPHSYQANHDLGVFYLDASQFQQAVPLLEEASRLHGRQAGDEYDLALACRGLNDFASAKRHVQRALQQKDVAEFHLLAGELEETLGNPLVAVREFQRATQLNPSEPNYFAWGSELLLHRAIWQAADVFATGSKNYARSVRMKTAWGASLFAGAQYNEASAKFCEASEMDPTAPEPYRFAGKIVMASTSTNACVGRTLERFLDRNPQSAEANYFYAMFLLKGVPPAPDRSRQLLLKAVELDSAYGDAYLQLGIMAAARKDYSNAIEYYRQAITADPKNSEAHYRLGMAYDRSGKPGEASEEYRLHEQIDAANAAQVEEQRRAVKQFSILPNASHSASKR